MIKDLTKTNRNVVNMKQTFLALVFLLSGLPGIMAQSAHPLSLDEAVKLGIANSKQLRQSKNKIEEALARFDQAKDAQLPSAKASFQYTHALMLARTINIEGLTRAPLTLPFDLPLYLGTLSFSEPIYSGNKLQLAKQSADLMVKMSKLDADKDSVEVAYLVISSYLTYNKILQSQTVEQRNMEDVDQKLAEITKFESQGLATKNDVLRFQLQKSRIELNQIELEKNREIANYNLDILLGLPDTSQISLTDVSYRLDEHPVYSDLLTQALSERRELQDLSYQDKIADVNLKKIKNERLPTVSANAGLNYVNFTQQPIPPANSILAPVTLGVGVSWDIASLYTNKNKVREANAIKEEVHTSRDQAQDDIRKDVHQAYLGYLESVQQLKVLQVAVDQAEENERITESKFKNALASTTDRIDAQTLLYQSRTNLELAKSDATIAYYNLLNATGTIHL